VKLIRSKRNQLVFEISPVEKSLLRETLELYPRVASAHHRLSRESAPAGSEERQRLLEESLATQREENRRNVRALLAEPGRFQPKAEGFLFTLSRPELEWLLQVVNDVRVGSWIALGSPDTEHGDHIVLDEKTAPHARSMELAGAFEMVFLDALAGRSAGESPK